MASKCEIMASIMAAINVSGRNEINNGSMAKWRK
jgi:hypothetical protein